MKTIQLQRKLPQETYKWLTKRHEKGERLSNKHSMNVYYHTKQDENLQLNCTLRANYTYQLFRYEKWDH